MSLCGLCLEDPLATPHQRLEEEWNLDVATLLELSFFKGLP